MSSSHKLLHFWSYLTCSSRTVPKILLAVLLSFLLFPKNVMAQANCNMQVQPKSPMTEPIENITLSFDKNVIEQEMRQFRQVPENSLMFFFTDLGCPSPLSDRTNPIFNIIKSDWPPMLISNFPLCTPWGVGKHGVGIKYGPPSTPNFFQRVICTPGEYQILPYQNTCKIDVTHDDKGDTTSNWTINVSDFDFRSDFSHFALYGDKKPIIPNLIMHYWEKKDTQIGFPQQWITAGYHTVFANPVKYDLMLNKWLEAGQCGFTRFEIAPEGSTPHPTPSTAPTPTQPAVCTTRNSKCDLEPDYCGPPCERCRWCINNQKSLLPPLQPLCDQFKDLTSFNYTECSRCVNGETLIDQFKKYNMPVPTGVVGAYTAIGCLPTDASLFLRMYVFTFGIGIAGGIAFLYFLYGAFLILTSAGNPEHIEEGKQIITSALSGLILIIFSMFLLRAIGVDILRLPGFS